MRRYLERLGEFVASKSNMKIALVRPTAVYGRWDNFDPATSHVIPALIRRAVEKEDPYEVWGSGAEIRDFLHITDLAHGCLLMLEKYATCDPVNIGYGKAVTIREIVRIILEAAGHETATVVFNTSKPTAIPLRMVDTSKAKDILGFEPKISLENGLKDTVEWYMQTRRLLSR
jgi:GDP-L-fucose synthase